MNQAKGYLGLLKNRNFVVLWLAQILSLLALNSTMFVAIILSEKATGSSTQTAAVIAAFSAPAVFLAAIAGIVVDRISKRRILAVSNGLRLILQVLLGVLAALALMKGLNTYFFLALAYLDIFVASAVGQFFAPAEGAMIPLVVGRDNLFAANSLFTLTVVGTQVAAFIVLVPLAVKILGVVNALLLLAIFYVGSTLLVMLLPRDPVPPRQDLGVRSISNRAWSEIAEGWRYAIRHEEILLGIFHYALVTFLIFAVAIILPGYAARVLGLAPEDAVFVFSPAGAGVLIASILVVRYGQRFKRHTLPIAGTIVMGLSFIAFGAISRLGNGTGEPLFLLHPDWTVTATTLVGAVSAVAGIGLALILIPAQTAVQEGSPDEVRGRVLTVQFTIANAVGIPPLLTISGLADVFGIPTIATGLGLFLLLISAIDYAYVRNRQETTREKLAAQPLPLPGSDASTVRSDDGVEREKPREQPVTR